MRGGAHGYTAAGAVRREGLGCRGRQFHFGMSQCFKSLSVKGRGVATTDGWRPQGGEGDTTATEGARLETTGVEVTLVNLALSCCIFFFSLARRSGK